MEKLSMVGILIKERGDTALRVQHVLTEYGEIIPGRFGLSYIEDGWEGLVGLVVKSSEKNYDKLMADLSELKGVIVKGIHLE